MGLSGSGIDNNSPSTSQSKGTEVLVLGTDKWSMVGQAVAEISRASQWVLNSKYDASINQR